MVLAPWRLVARHHVDQHRAHHAEVVDAAVLEEALVLGGEEGVLHQLRNLVVGDRDAPLLADLRDQRAAARVDAQRHLQLHVAHRFDRRQRGHQIHVTAGERVRAQKCDRASHRRPARPESESNSISQKPTLLCLRYFGGAMHSSRRFRANSPKGGDAKPPVYGTQVPMTAGLPVRTLTHSAAMVTRAAAGSSTDRLHPLSRLQSPYLPRAPRVPRTLGPIEAAFVEIRFVSAARDAVGSPRQPDLRVPCAFRESPSRSI